MAERFGITSTMHASIGKAIEAYAETEQVQARILHTAIGTSFIVAKILFFSVQNVRSRNATMQGILCDVYSDRYRSFWKKASAFLLKLSEFRNGLVHWTQIGPAISFDDDGDVSLEDGKLLHPTDSRRFEPITEAQISEFIDDCEYIRRELDNFERYLRASQPNVPLRQKFLKPELHPNRAVLKQPLIPTE